MDKMWFNEYVYVLTGIVYKLLEKPVYWLILGITSKSLGFIDMK